MHTPIQDWRSALPRLAHGFALIPIGARPPERKAPVDPTTGTGLRGWQHSTGFDPAAIAAMDPRHVIACGINTGHHGVCVIDIDGASAADWLRQRGADPSTVRTWKITRDTDPDRYKLVFRLTPEQEQIFPRTKLLLRTVKGEALEVYFQPGAQVLAIGEHCASGGNYQWVNGPEDTAIPDAIWLDVLVAIREAVQELRGKGDISRPRSVRGHVSGGKWIASGHGNPCPICARIRSAACTWTYTSDGRTIATCFHGSADHCPPAGLKKGDVITGSDGRQWGFVETYYAECLGDKSLFINHDPASRSQKPQQGPSGAQAAMPWLPTPSAAPQPAAEPAVVPFALQPQLDAVAEADVALRELQDLASMPDLALADFIPPGLAAMLTRRAASFPVDPNAFVLPILTVVSSIIGNRIRSQFKPGHIESLAIWGANVQPASAMKSPVFGVFLGPLNEWEGEFRKSAKAERQRWRRDRSTAAMGETGPAAKDTIRQWEEDNPAPDPARTLSVNDATLERIAQYLQADNTTGLLQFADELMSWLSSMRRGKDAPDQRGNWLSSWSGGAMKISRVTREDSYVPHALISILGAIQPLAVLQLREQALREGRTVRDGLWARMLLWRPRRLPYDYQAPGYCCREAILNFYKQLDRLAPHIAEDAMPALLSFSPDAIHLAGQAFNSWDEQSRKVDDSELGEWLGKLRGYAIRIAAILHCIERAATEIPLGDTIAVETVARSLLLCNHLIAQYRLASVELDIDTDITEADPLVLKLIARLATWRKDNPGKGWIALSDIGLMGIPRRRSPAGEVAQWLDLTLNHHPQIGTVVVGLRGGLVLQLNT